MSAPAPLLLGLVTASVFGFATSVTMIGPLLLDIGGEFSLSVGHAGLLATAMALPWACGAPFAGLLSDRLGRRPLMVLALAGLGASSLAAALAPSFGTLLCARFVAGCFGACGPASVLAAIGDLFPDERRARAMGWFNMGFGLAALIGVPLASAIAGWLGWRAAFSSAGAMLLAVAGVVRVAFPPTPGRGSAGGVLVASRAIVGAPRLGHLLAANLLERLGFFAATLYVPSFLMLAYERGPAGIAPVLALIAAGSVLGNPLGGWLGDRAPRATVFAATQLGTSGLAVALFAQQPGLGASAALALLFALVNAMGRPAILALGSEWLPGHRGAVLGLLGVTNQGGVVLGSAVGGLVIGLGGYGALAVMVGASGLVAASLGASLRRPAGAP